VSSLNRLWRGETGITMYTQWSKITERDLLQKGASCNKVKNFLKIEKVVLNLTLPQIGNALISSSQSKGDSKSGSNKAASGGAIKPKGLTKASSNTEGTSKQSMSISNLYAMSLLAIISGQRPSLTKARQSIANWKIRKNQVLGCKVTLRGKSALEFLDKTIRFQSVNEKESFEITDASSKARGLASGSSALVGSFSPSFQSLGNLSIGIKKLTLYPELEDLRIAQPDGRTLGFKPLGLDLSLNFKNNKEVYKVIKASLRQPGGKQLISASPEEYTRFLDKHQFMRTPMVNTQPSVELAKTEAVVMSGNKLPNLKLSELHKSFFALHTLIHLRKLYLTSLGYTF
jgi:ribosomal protein L5